MRNFPSPHVHPESLDSASTLKKMAKREVELGTGAITATDHGSMGACRAIYDLAKKNNLIPILGLEAYVRDDSCPILLEEGVSDPKAYNKYYHVTLHAIDEEAYKALSRVLSKAALTRCERHGSEEKPLFNWADLEYLGQYNVTVGSGCLVGMVQRHLISTTPNAKLAIKYYEKLRSSFKPGNFYVEVFPHATDKQWVNGVYVTFADGTKKKFWAGKKLRTNLSDEIEASSLVGRKGHTHLLGIKDYSNWIPVEQEIAKVEMVKDYIQNECSPFAPDGDTQKSCNRFMVAMANKYKDPILISDDAHFAYPEDKIVQDCRLGGAAENWKFYSSYHRHTSQEALEFFRSTLHVKDAVFEQWVENAYVWANRFKDFTFHSRPSLPTKFYPQDTLEHTYRLIAKHGRYNENDPAQKERLESEIELLHRNGTIDLLPYFFLGEEANGVYVANDQITGPGRGSAAGLLLAYLLGITHVDPLRHGLSKDRFLTMDRIKSGKLPDIDQDFPSRDLLVGTADYRDGWLYRRFGDHFAQISTNTVLRVKSSIKDVSRALRGRVPPDIEALTGKMEMPPQGVSDHDFVFGYHTDDGHDIKGAIETSEPLKEYIRKYPDDWAIVQEMLGITRQKSRHACGFIIANEPIPEISPVRMISGIPTTEYPAPDIEAAGGVKMDFLIVNSLADIQDCIKLVQDRVSVGGTRFQFPATLKLKSGVTPRCRLVPFHDGSRWKTYDVWDLPADPTVFKEVSGGATETVFQFNTPAARQWLHEFNHRAASGGRMIESVSDMSVFTALDRPGPLDAYVKDKDGGEHNMLQEYAYRARGKDPVGEIPALNGILPDTYGLMVYQEQLQKVYQELTGCTGAEAEEFRSNVAKKKMEKVNKAFPFFMEHATERIGEEAARALWDTIVTWGQYGFCLDGDQNVLTTGGPVPMKDVRPGDTVMSWGEGGGRWASVAAAWCSGEKEVFEVELEDGTIIRGTEDHMFMYDGEWVALKDLIYEGHMEVVCPERSCATAESK